MKSASIGLLGLAVLLVVVEKTSSLSTAMRPEKLVCPGFKFARLGCYKDDQNKPRPLPKLVFTDRDKTSDVYSGTLINWKKWDEYMNSLICRCAQKSLSKGYKRIGLQHYGECWSGEDSQTASYGRSGPSQHCLTWRGKKCTGGKDCAGEDHANFVYHVERDSKPTGRPTAKPTKPTKPTKPPTPRPTPSPTPKPTTKPTPKPTRRPTTSPSKPPTTPGASTPTASGTSTVKPTEQPTAAPNPCTPAAGVGCQQLAPSCAFPPAGVGCQQPAPSCAFPPCIQPAPPQVMAPVPYQAQAAPYPMITCGRSRIPCPADCQPNCNQDCCKMLYSKTADSKKRTITTLDDSFDDGDE